MAVAVAVAIAVAVAVSVSIAVAVAVAVTVAVAIAVAIANCRFRRRCVPASPSAADAVHRLATAATVAAALRSCCSPLCCCRCRCCRIALAAAGIGGCCRSGAGGAQTVSLSRACAATPGRVGIAREAVGDLVERSAAPRRARTRSGLRRASPAPRMAARRAAICRRCHRSASAGRLPWPRCGADRPFAAPGRDRPRMRAACPARSD